MKKLSVDLDEASFRTATSVVDDLTKSLQNLNLACDGDLSFDDVTEVVPRAELARRAKNPMDIVRYFWRSP